MQLAQHWQKRFAAFAARKRRLAMATPLPPYVTDIDEPGDDALVVGNAWSMRLFDGAFYLSPARDSARPACSLVFVQSADRNTGASDPATLGGGSTDKHLIYEGLSRVAADAVLAGAETVRGTELIFSVWHPELVMLRASLSLPRHPVQIVATRRGLDLDGALVFNVPDVPVILLTLAGGAQVMQDGLARRSWITPLVMEHAGDLARTFEQLRAAGVTRVSCVGGRGIAAQLLDARLVDDVYLTTSPHEGGAPDTPISSRPLPGRVVVRKHGTGTESGVVFEHVSGLR